jgi:DTW domain-containing protein YfiP
MHTAEEPLTTNTGRLAAKALPNSEIRIRGRKNERLSTLGLVEEGRHSLILYPSPHAVELSSSFVSGLTKPATLIVPDGSWAQTRRMVRREKGLAGILHVRPPHGPPSEYHVRLQPSEKSLCTLEAIARSIGALESREAQSRLESLLRVMVHRTLWSRGTIAAHPVFPPGLPGRTNICKLPASDENTLLPASSLPPRCGGREEAGTE